MAGYKWTEFTVLIAQAKCKSGEHWTPATKKCARVPESKLTLISSRPTIRNTSFRAYQLTSFNY